MKTKKVLFYGIAALMAGCVPVVSLHPLVSPGTLTFDQGLIGAWLDEPKGAWEFSRTTPADANMLPDALSDARDKVYCLDYRDENGRKGAFFACLVKLDDKLFLDVFPRAFPSGHENPEKVDLPYNTLFFVPAHTFIRVNEISNQLKMRMTDDEAFAKLSDAERSAVEATSVNDAPVLTASTEALQAFFLKHADDEQLFSNEVVLTRKSQN